MWTLWNREGYRCNMPNVSGNPKDSPWYATPEGKRGTQQVKLRLAPEIADKLERLAEAKGVTKSALVAEWVARAKG